MQHFTPSDRAAVASVRRDIGLLELGAAPILADLGRALRPLLGVDAFASYGLTDKLGGGSLVSFVHVDGGAREFQRRLPRYAERAAAAWTAFDPRRPAPFQRNRVLATTQLVDAGVALPAAKLREFYLAVGLSDWVCQLRVLVCDGSRFLAWVGAFAERSFDLRQRAILSALVPALRRRLVAERRVASLDHGGLLSSALEAIDTPALVVDARGDIQEANEAARLLVDLDGRILREEMLAAVRAAVHPRWRITRWRASGRPDYFLIVGRREHSLAPSGPVTVHPTRTADFVVARLREIAEAWQATSRELSVLRQLVAGDGNKEIARGLACSEVTVERCVTSLLRRSGCDGRTRLVARFWRGD